jgi:sugar lactone lactonase YvrE
MIYDGYETNIYCDLDDFHPHQFNDMIISKNGIIYSGSCGCVMKKFADIKKDTQTIIVAIVNQKPIIAADNLNFPNGLVTTKEDTLIVAESFSHKLTEFDINKDASLTNRRLFIELNKDFCPDGICLDLEGSGVWISDSYSGSCIRVDRANKKITHEIHINGNSCLACAIYENNVYLCTKNKKNIDTINITQKTGCIEKVKISL